MATFSVDFLGCKVSHIDAQHVRERLLADGHDERAGGDDCTPWLVDASVGELVRVRAHDVAEEGILAA